MKNIIHPTSIIDKSVELGEGNVIGPYCVITGKVKIGSNNKFKSHVVIDVNNLTIGDNNQLYPFVSLNAPQDKKYRGEDSKLIIGNDNVFREYFTSNPGTEAGIMETRIGNDCLFMASSHVAHDCLVGNNVTVANSVALAGHVIIEDYVTLGGLSAVHQRTRIGAYAMIGGMSAIDEDIIPYGMALGNRAHLAGLNIVGLRRRGFSKSDIQELRAAYDILFAVSNDKLFSERIALAAAEFSDSKIVMYMLNFIKNSASKPICKPV